jgi:hypothetical protein
MSVELIALLFDLDMRVVQSELSQEDAGLQQIVELYQPMLYQENQKVFDEKFAEYAECRVNYQYARERYLFAFNDIEGEVNHFEFYGRQ